MPVLVLLRPWVTLVRLPCLKVRQGCAADCGRAAQLMGIEPLVGIELLDKLDRLVGLLWRLAWVPHHESTVDGHPDFLEEDRCLSGLLNVETLADDFVDDALRTGLEADLHPKAS